MQELETGVESWNDDRTSLILLRDSLEGGVSVDDITVLQERLQLLQRQWEEVSHQVRMHTLQIFAPYFLFPGKHSKCVF